LLACGIAGWPESSYAELLGTYGYSYTGTVLGSAGFNGPIAGVGEFDLDGRGNLSGTETFNVTGTVCSGTLAGTYTVASDDTGTVTAAFTPSTAGCPSGTFHLYYSAVEDGRKIYFLQTDPGRVAAGEAEKKRE
jgi:hypothetical protein